MFQVFDHQQQVEFNGWPLADIISGISFIVLLWALYASLRAARETARANMLNFLPLVTLEYSHKDDEVIVVNMGRSTAVNVRVDSFYQWWADGQFDLYGQTKLVFDEVSLLNAGKRMELNHRIRGMQDPLGLAKFAMFSAEEKPLLFAIRFSDLSGQKFITKVRIHKSEVTIASAPRPYGMRAKGSLFFMRCREFVTLCFYALKVKYMKYKNRRAKKPRQKQA